jgi:prepilin-type N-terminal cleavage/methylation domain-containing protein
MIARLRALRGRERVAASTRSGEAGFSIVELLIVMAILGLIVGSLGALFVSAMNAEADISRRFQAQTDARLALDKVRRETHCASAATLPNATRVELTMPSWCPTSGGAATTVTWCARSTGTGVFGLFRIAPSVGSCTGGVRFANNLTTDAVFALVAADTANRTLPKLSVDFTVDLTPATTSVGRYRLQDAIVLRNATR